MFKLRKTICLIMSAVTAAAAVSFSSLSASASYMLMGDVNCDGSVTLRDATVAQKIDIGLVNANSDQKYVGDMDKNGTVSVSDAYLIQRLATRDPDVMNGNESAGIPAFCPSRAYRVGFYDALNAERTTQGLSTITYTEGMLAAGQELCQAWYLDFMDQVEESSKQYYGDRIVEDQYGRTKRYYTVFADYGMQNGSSSALVNASYGASPNGKSFFSSLRSDYKRYGESSSYYSIYHDVLMNPDLTVLCVGQIETSSRTALWIITGY